MAELVAVWFPGMDPAVKCGHKLELEVLGVYDFGGLPALYPCVWDLCLVRTLICVSTILLLI